MIRRALLWEMLANLALLLFQAVLVSLWYLAVFEPPDFAWGLILLILFGILSASQLIPLDLSARNLSITLRTILLGGWFLAAAFLSLKVFLFLHVPLRPADLLMKPVLYILQAGAPGESFYHVLFIGLLVWRGVIMARRPAGLSGIQATFQLGLAALLLYGMVYAPLYPAEASFGLYLYLFFGLIAMSAARVAQLSELRGGRIPIFGAGWLTILLLSGLAFVGLALLVSKFISGRVEDFLAAVVLVFLAILTAVTLLLLSPLLILLSKAIPYLVGLLEQALAQLNALVERIQAQKLIGDLDRFVKLLFPFLWAARGLVLLSMLFVVLIAIFLALRFHHPREETAVEEETGKAGLSEPGGLFQKFVRQILQDARRLRLRDPARLLAAARIRRIYSELMDLSQKMGEGRPPSITPLEFLPQLERIFPGEKPALEQITLAYVKVRYGEYPETRREVMDVENAWKRVRQRKNK